jgi:hypothetical protein
MIGNVNINKKENHRKGGILNDITVALISLISVINIVISSLGIDGAPIPTHIPLALQK